MLKIWNCHKTYLYLPRVKKVYYLIREYPNTEAKTLEPVIKAGHDIDVGRYYYALDMFGNKLTQYKLVTDEELNLKSYIKKLITYARNRAKRKSFECSDGSILTGRQFANEIKSYKFMLPHQIDAGGRVIK